MLSRLFASFLHRTSHSTPHSNSDTPGAGKPVHVHAARGRPDGKRAAAEAGVRQGKPLHERRVAAVATGASGKTAEGSTPVLEEIARLLAEPSVDSTRRERLRAALARTTRSTDRQEWMALLEGAAALVARESPSRTMAVADFLRATAPVVPEEAVRALVRALQHAGALSSALCASITSEILLLGDAERQHALKTWADELALVHDPALLQNMYAHCAWYVQDRDDCEWVVEALSSSVTSKETAAGADERTRKVLGALAALRQSPWARLEGLLLIDAAVNDRSGWIKRAMALADAATVDHVSQVLSGIPVSGAEAALAVLHRLLDASDAPHRLRYPRPGHEGALPRDFENWLRLVPKEALDPLCQKVLASLERRSAHGIAVCLGALARRTDERRLLDGLIEAGPSLTMAQLRAGLVAVLRDKASLLPVGLEALSKLPEDRRGALAVALVDATLYRLDTVPDSDNRLQTVWTFIGLAPDHLSEAGRIAMAAAFSHRVCEHLIKPPVRAPATGANAQALAQGLKLGTSPWTALYVAPAVLRKEPDTLRALMEVFLLPAPCADAGRPCLDELGQLLRLEFPDSDAGLKDPLLRDLALSYPAVLQVCEGFRAVHSLMLRELVAPRADEREAKSQEGPGPGGARRPDVPEPMEALCSIYDALGAADPIEGPGGLATRLDCLAMARDQVKDANLRTESEADLRDAIEMAVAALSAKSAPAGAAAPEKPARTQ